MDIIYRKDTLFVNLEKSDNMDTMEKRVNSIMDVYKIENLVVNTNGNDFYLDNFEKNYNKSHKSKVFIK
jgi:hypothetical protein